MQNGRTPSGFCAMPEQYTDEWWHIQASPLVFPFDDFAEAMTQAIVRVHRKQLDDIGGFTVERANDAGSVSGVAGIRSIAERTIRRFVSTNGAFYLSPSQKSLFR